jgi:hypothetical protein
MAVSKSFILAGDAIFTVQLPDGGHKTYRVQRVEANDRYPEAFFVKLLVGPDNGDDYGYVGKLDAFTGQVATTAKSKQYDGSLVLRLLNRVLARVWTEDHQAYEVFGYQTHHEGRCGRCGRRLTVPASIESGIGPECQRIMGAEAAAPLSQDDEDRMVQDAERADEEARCRYKMARDEAFTR